MSTQQTLLAADIGGTNARFALYAARSGRNPVARARLRTAHFASFRELVEAALADLAAQTPLQPVAAALAVAGPVRLARFCDAPNIAYALNMDDLPDGLLPRRAALLNDFTAQALGCRALGREGTVAVGQDAPMDPALTQAVVGPGTGLGKAALVPDGRGGYVVCASEGGHAAFPFATGEEDFARFAAQALGTPYVRWEDVVSGPGLALLHRFLTGQAVTPEQAGERLSDGGPLLELFATVLGRACRDYALDVAATGGLYVSGGVAARNQAVLEHPAFLRVFRACHTQPGLLERVPVRLVTDQDVGLLGAAAFAGTLL